nr:ABC transporter permease subunit [uncultured Eisenbergiella sp.]
MKNKKNKGPKKNRIPAKEVIKSFRTQKQMWIICAGALLWVLIFCYIPMMGNIIAFFDYIPGRSLFECDFIGFKNWIDFFSLPDMWRVFRNTLVISGLSMTIGFVMPIIFALLLNEIHHTLFKKVIQTISYLPYFISWVVVASILFTLLGTEGNINSLLMHFGWIQKPISFLNEKNYFWGILTSANIWKDLGWSAIIYISAIAGVDQELYQAGAVDGLGRFGKVWHITLPGIAPTIILLFIMNIGNILNAGFEQQLLIGNPLTKEVYENIDTYVYRYGVQIGRYSFATAVGLMKSVIGFALVMIANKISAKVTDMRLF